MAAAVWLCTVKVDRMNTDPVASELSPPQVRQCFMATVCSDVTTAMHCVVRRPTVSEYFCDAMSNCHGHSTHSFVLVKHTTETSQQLVDLHNVGV